MYGIASVGMDELLCSAKSISPNQYSWQQVAKELYSHILPRVTLYCIVIKQAGVLMGIGLNHHKLHLLTITLRDLLTLVGLESVTS